MGEDTDAHGTSIVGPSSPDATGYADLDRQRMVWRGVTFTGILAGLGMATVLAAWTWNWAWIVTGMFVALMALIGGGFGNAVVTARARSRDDDVRARRVNSALPGDPDLFPARERDAHRARWRGTGASSRPVRPWVDPDGPSEPTDGPVGSGGCK